MEKYKLTVEKIDDLVEDDMLFGLKMYDCNYDDPDFVKQRKDYFENFLIPQAREKGQVTWNDGTTAYCSVTHAKKLYRQFA